MRRTAWLDARLVCPASGRDERGGVLVENGRVADVGPRVVASSVGDAEVVDCAGAVLAPGLFDLRVRAGEPGEPQKEDFRSAAAAAAAGGVTSMAVLPDARPVVDSDGGIAFVERRARRARGAKIFPWAALTRGAGGREITEMGLLSEAGAVGFTDGATPVADSRLMLQALRYGRAFDALVAQRPEDRSLAAGGAMNGGAVAARLGLSGAPAVAEVMGLERDLRLVELSGARYHACAVSTRAAVEAIGAAKAKGLRVSADTSPQYFLLTEEEAVGYRTFARLSPPLRREDDRAAVADAVADGTIDAVSGGHEPQDQESKRVPFADAEPGITGLETLLGLTHLLVERGAMALPDALARLSSAPAAILGRRAALERGAAADMVLFEPGARWRVDPEAMRSRSRNTLFAGRRLGARVLASCVDGRAEWVGPRPGGGGARAGAA